MVAVVEHQHCSTTSMSASSGQCSSLSQLTQLLQDEARIHQAQDHVTLAKEGCRATSLVWRERVAQWCYDVVDHLEESRRLVYITMNILDRYVVTTNTAKTDRAFEAAALTALFLAVRIRGTRVLEVIDLVRMSRLGVTIREIVDVGKTMTRALSFDKKLVTPTDFLSHFLALAGSHDDSSNATFLTELAVVDSFFVGTRASEIALASVMNALGKNDVSTLMNALSPELKKLADKVSPFCTRLNVLRNKTDAGQPHLIPDSDTEVASVVPVLTPPVRVVSQEKLGGMKRMKRSFSCQGLATLIEADSPSEEPPSKRSRVND